MEKNGKQTDVVGNKALWAKLAVERTCFWYFNVNLITIYS